MQGTWGRRVYGKVSTGTKYTRFRLELVLQNDATIYETTHVANDVLEKYPNIYKWTLDNLTEKLDERLKNHL